MHHGHVNVHDLSVRVMECKRCRCHLVALDQHRDRLGQDVHPLLPAVAARGLQLAAEALLRRPPVDAEEEDIEASAGAMPPPLPFVSEPCDCVATRYSSAKHLLQVC